MTDSKLAAANKAELIFLVGAETSLWLTTLRFTSGLKLVALRQLIIKGSST